MVSINYSAREVCCKIVYYGPGLSGKTTNLQYVHSKVPQNTRGKLISLATEADRTLYFDFLPLNIGSINGLTAKFQLYTVPGQVYYNATRKLVLRGVDGVVFVADSQRDKMDDNLESLSNLEDNLAEYGYDVNTLPIVIQYNKRDLPGVMTVDELNARLNPRGYPTFEASATIGNGVFDTLKLIIKLVLDKAKRSSAPKSRPAAVVEAQAAPPAPAPEPTPYPSATPPQAPAAAAPPSGQPTAQPEPSSLSRQPAASQPQVSPPSPSASPVGQSVPPASQSPAAPAAEAPAYRPYPGSNQRVQTVAPEQQPAPAQAAAGPQPQTNNETPPQMAPSARARDEGKKRGFFKRLFGIK
ncbi:GTPase domain-containing protein [bacterium]|nr:GTPase domain-containing protein [bacterium]